MNDAGFDLESAGRLLPELERLLRAALEAKKRLTETAQQQARRVEHIVMSGGSQADLGQFSQWKKDKQEWGGRLHEAIEEIETLGCLVKDLDIGLVDFPCRIGEREIYLCWRLGEPHIQHWHNTDEGFSSRKRIDGQFTQDLQRSRVH